MSVISRLRRLTGEGEKKEEHPSQSTTISELRKRIETVMSRRPPAGLGYQRFSYPSLEDVIEGEESANGDGTYFVCHRNLSPGSYHGCHCIGDIGDIDMEAAACLAGNPELCPLYWQEGLFLDVETTGLCGGSGTVAFLVGVGWFENGSFLTRQIFMRDFAEERAVLRGLQELADGKRFLVTFNGKAFDINLLAGRFVMNRLADPLSGLPHLDLLHPVRRLLGHRLENCRLATLETQILGVERDEDIPGSEIPQRYFDWLRRRNACLMKDVFEHNRLDIISMATLSAHLVAMLNGTGTLRHEGSDLLAVAALFCDRNEADKARQLLERVADHGEPAGREACKMLSLIHKRSGNWQEAVSLWQKLIERDAGDIFAIEELAKWYEHRQAEFGQAVRLIDQVLEHSFPLTEAEKENLLYRRRRLVRRAGKG